MKNLFRASALATIMSLGAFAQTGAISGKVKGPDGQPLVGAWAKIVRKDIKGEYFAETNKKGEYFHAGLPLGQYDVILLVDATKEKKKPVGGKEADAVRGVRVPLGDPVDISFDLAKNVQKQQAMAKAAESGELTQEQKRDMSPEQKAAIEKAMKERSAALAKNKELNEAFNQGMAALGAKNYDQAVEQFKKGSEMDAKQHVIWANLAESYFGQAATKPAAEQAAIFDAGIKAYNSAIELKPDDAGYHNNFGLALVKAKKFKEAEEELTKAAVLDPSKAGMYFFNLGAILTNLGQAEPAGAAFKKAIDADPNYAEAHYQYGLYLMGKAQTTADGKTIPPPGTKEAFQKYIELKPTGPNSDAAKGMIQAIEATVTTTFENPDAKKKTTTKKK
ncbi:MAG: tetratricopeptide repeat protein [Bryobacteraceae bacterium]